MPRRKVTRAKAPLNIPEIPGLAITEEMSMEERKEQLEIYMKDFHFKINKSQKFLDNEGLRQRLKLKSLFDMMLQQIPPSLWDMKLKDFVAAGGTVEAALKQEQKADILKKIEKRIGNLAPLKEESPDENSAPRQELSGSSCAEGPEQKAKVTRTLTQAFPPSVMRPPVRQSARASKSKYATPGGRQTRGGWGATPMVTPKFDPRLPITPENIREMQPGERLMSIAGSPVRVENVRRKGGIGAGNDKDTNVEDVVKAISNVLDLSPGRREKVLSVLME